MNRVQLVLLILIGVCAGSSAFAADALPPSLRACMSEADASRRLACFDRESERLEQATAPAARKAEPPASAPVAASPTPAVAAPAAAATASTVKPAAPDAAAAAQDKFGYRGNIARAEMDKKSEQERRDAEELVAKVAELSTMPLGELLLTLDNGQVWQQKRSDRAMRIKVGDEVTIRRATLGSFLLTSQAANGSMRVSRVK
jgi:hypothetical protein